VINEGGTTAIDAPGLGRYLYRVLLFVAHDRGDDGLANRIFRVRPMCLPALSYEAIEEGVVSHSGLDLGHQDNRGIGLRNDRADYSRVRWDGKAWEKTGYVLYPGGSCLNGVDQ